MSLNAIRDNPLRAGAIGIPVNRRLIAVYTIAAAFAGVAGRAAGPDGAVRRPRRADFEKSADVMLVLVIGGAGYLYGGIIGAVVFKILQDWLSWLTPQYWHFWVGLILVIIVLIGRDRISRWGEALTAPILRLFSRSKPRAAAETGAEPWPRCWRRSSSRSGSAASPPPATSISSWRRAHAMR